MTQVLDNHLLCLIKYQGGLPMYVATRGLYNMRPPTIFVPEDIKEHVEKLFEVHRAMDHSELNHNLVGLNVGMLWTFFLSDIRKLVKNKVV